MSKAMTESGKKRKEMVLRYEYSDGGGRSATQKINEEIYRGSFSAKDIISIVHESDGVAKWVVVYYRS